MIFWRNFCFFSCIKNKLSGRPYFFLLIFPPLKNPSFQTDFVRILYTWKVVNSDGSLSIAQAFLWSVMERELPLVVTSRHNIQHIWYSMLEHFCFIFYTHTMKYTKYHMCRNLHMHCMYRKQTVLSPQRY